MTESYFCYYKLDILQLKLTLKFWRNVFSLIYTFTFNLNEVFRNLYVPVVLKIDVHGKLEDISLYAVNLDQQAKALDDEFKVGLSLGLSIHLKVFS